MKKVWILAGAALLCLLGEAGCSKSESSEQNTPSLSSVVASSEVNVLPSMKGSKLSEQIRTDLTSSGWTIRDCEPASLGIFQTSQPTLVFTIRNNQNQMAFLSWFDTVEQAEACYQALLPDDSSVQEEKGANFHQAVIPMPNQSGLWVLRQVGGNLFGVWAPDSTQKDSLIALLDSFQAAQ